MMISSGPRRSDAELHVLCAVALRPALVEIVRMFERETEAAVSIEYDFNPAVARRIEHGERFEVAVTNPHLIEKLAGLGLVDKATCSSVGRSPLGLAAHRERGSIDISSVAAFKRALLEARTIGYTPEGTSGRLLTSILERIGIASAIAQKLRPVAGGYAGEAVAKGEVEFAIVPITTILAAAPDAALVGTLPAELGINIDFTAAISPLVNNRSLAAHFVELLRSPRIDSLLRSRGVARVPAAA